MGKKLTEAEKWQRKAERATAKEKAAAGMFADHVPETTAADLYWKWRADRAAAAGANHTTADPGNRLLAWVELQAIERAAAGLIGPEVAADLAAYVRGTYPMPDYGRHVWAGLLTGTSRVAYRLRLEFDPARVNQYNRDGRYVVEEAAFPPAGWVPVLTRDQFAAMFPPLDHKRAAPADDEPDDGGLFERTIGALPGAKS